MYINFPETACSPGPLFHSKCVSGSIFSSREVRAASEKAEDDGDSFQGMASGNTAQDF